MVPSLTLEGTGKSVTWAPVSMRVSPWIIRENRWLSLSGGTSQGLQGSLGQRPCQLYLFKRSGCGIPESAVRLEPCKRWQFYPLDWDQVSWRARSWTKALNLYLAVPRWLIRDPDFCSCQYREPVAHLVRRRASSFCLCEPGGASSLYKQSLENSFRDPCEPLAPFSSPFGWLFLKSLAFLLWCS